MWPRRLWSGIGMAGRWRVLLTSRAPTGVLVALATSSAVLATASTATALAMRPDPDAGRPVHLALMGGVVIPHHDEVVADESPLTPPTTSAAPRPRPHHKPPPPPPPARRPTPVPHAYAPVPPKTPPPPVYRADWRYWGPRIRGCESWGDPKAPPNYSAENPQSGASGAYQFLDSTWAGRYGVPKARMATPEQQEAAAYELFLHDGTRPWAASEACWHPGLKARTTTTTAPPHPSSSSSTSTSTSVKATTTTSAPK